MTSADEVVKGNWAAWSKGGDLPASGCGGEEPVVRSVVGTDAEAAFGTISVAVAFVVVGTLAIYCGTVMGPPAVIVYGEDFVSAKYSVVTLLETMTASSTGAWLP